jgi:hypothetical protein
VGGRRLYNGKSKSCGCLAAEQLTQRQALNLMHARTHGMSKTPLYKSWEHMKYAYRDQIDPAWMQFENFQADVGGTYFRGAHLNRINLTKPFSKTNILWC